MKERNGTVATNKALGGYQAEGERGNQSRVGDAPNGGCPSPVCLLWENLGVFSHSQWKKNHCIFLPFVILTDPLDSQQRPHRGRDTCLRHTTTRLHPLMKGRLHPLPPGPLARWPHPCPARSHSASTCAVDSRARLRGAGSCQPGADSSITRPWPFPPPPSSCPLPANSRGFTKPTCVALGSGTFGKR